MERKTLGQWLFRYRSYTPLVLLVPLLVFAQPTPVSLIIGAVFVLVGEMLRFWGVMYAGGETRTTERVGATQLVTQGPFAYVRNPLYVGNMLIYFGIAVMGNSLFPFLPVIALIFFGLQYYFIVLEEEKYLKAAFGAEYDRYTAQVRRFLPGKPYDRKQQSGLRPNVRKALQSEKRTFQAIVLIVTVLLIIYYLRD